MLLCSAYFLFSTIGKIPQQLDVKTWKGALGFGLLAMFVGIFMHLATQDTHAPVFTILVVACLTGWGLFEIYCYRYFGSNEFSIIKETIADHVQECNDLNRHIENLKNAYANIQSFDYGKGELRDNSNFNFKRSEWSKYSQNNRTHNCSASVLNNVRSQPVKYFCKYFDIQTSEEGLASIEGVLNAFAAAEQGKHLLINERDHIVGGIVDSVPWPIKTFARNRLLNKLGFSPVDLSDLYFPVYKFQYISSGGNSSAQFLFKLDLGNLERLIEYLGNLVKFRKSIQGQRSLMTTQLREQIKIRDNYSCKICHVSIEDEPNLLLEIDHIVPLSKGGVTSIDNLQTLCWKCNRSKGAKILSSLHS